MRDCDRNVKVRTIELKQIKYKQKLIKKKLYRGPDIKQKERLRKDSEEKYKTVFVSVREIERERQ